MGGLALERLELDGGSSHEELELQLFEQPTGLHGVFQYDVEIFDASTIEELAGDLNALLAEIVRAPERRIEELAAANHSRRRGQGEG
jgi:non-ribosomal peptide synthetase component F